MSIQKAIFLDRDGTIIQGMPYLSSPEQIVLLPYSARAIKLFKEEGFLVIIATNQSGIARGYFTEDRLKEIHERLLDMLFQEGASIDAIYYCPHLPEGVVEKYNIECQCRKPKTGMLLMAAREHVIDLKKSIMIGDTPVDILAGKAVGCKTVLVKNHEEEMDMPVEADLIVNDIWEAAQFLCSKDGAKRGVIASEAKQSHHQTEGLLRGFAPRNDDL